MSEGEAVDTPKTQAPDALLPVALRHRRLQRAAHPQGVFLHTGWRSGGTWLWSKLRELETVEAYYEPLHEHLASLTPKRIGQLNALSWKSGHGETWAYYLEYAALLKLPMVGTAHGVSHYQPRFATERFFLAPDDDDPALKHYLESLLVAAAYIERAPVLKFCRSLGRVGWMAAQFPGALHAVLLRNPAAQWQSSRAQYHLTGNRYFLVAPCLVLARNRSAPLVAAALAHFAVALPSLPADARGLDGELCWRHLLRLDWPARQRIFLAYWLVTAATSLDSDAVLAIDLECIAHSPAYRARLERIFEDAGMGVCLAGSLPQPPPAADFDAANQKLTHDWLDGAAHGFRPAGHALVAKKLGVRPQSGRTAPPPTPAGQPIAKPAAMIRSTWLTLYFAVIALSMPLRHLHGRLRGPGAVPRR